ncbi:hypothetical protein ACFX13_046228 [Malus domestica]
MEEERARKKLLILYATQTGNALDVAERLAAKPSAEAAPSTSLPRPMRRHKQSSFAFNFRCLAQEGTVIFVVSTTGQGDTPDPMKGFWKDLLQKNLSRQWLDGLRYSVFGLGDSGYQKFNVYCFVPFLYLLHDCLLQPVKLDRRLLDLGATPIVERGLGDDQHPYEAALDPWMASLWNMWNKIDPNYFPNGPDFFIPYENFMAKPKIRILYHDIDKVDSQVSSKSGNLAVHSSPLSSITVYLQISFYGPS